MHFFVRHGPVEGAGLVLEVAVERGVGCVDQLAHGCLQPVGVYSVRRHGCTGKSINGEATELPAVEWSSRSIPI
jgi:hypothetical protein